MIVPMRMAYVVCRSDDRDELLEALGELGVIHLAPVEPDQAVASESQRTAIDQLDRAMQILQAVESAGQAPDVSPTEAAEEVLAIQRQTAEDRSHLATLAREIEHLAVWGDVRLEQFEILREAGVDPKFYIVPAEQAGDVSAELVQVFREMPGKRVLVAAVDRTAQPTVPDDAEPLDLPSRDRPTLRAEARQIDTAIRERDVRLSRLAHLLPEMRRTRDERAREAEFTAAERSGLAEGELFAVRGWVPEDRAEALPEGLAARGVDAAVETFDPPAEVEPPTLVRYPRWARPIQGLFDILGTVPGYRELDLSGFFMLALPLFAAMLIGDAGYGLIFLLLGVLAYRPLVDRAGRAKTHLILIVGAVTLLWGILTANYFGVTPGAVAQWGGYTRTVGSEIVADYQAMAAGDGTLAAIGNTMRSVALLWDADEEAARFLIIKVSFLIGTIHLVLAHLRQAVAYSPDAKALSEVGWCLVLGGMLGVIWRLFEFAMPSWLLWTAVGAIGVGYLLVVLFTHPQYGWVRRVGIGLAGSLLPLISTFGDTMSYIRLMAVGLASYYIASAFNDLGAMVAEATPWLWVVGVPIILFGHALNIGLAVIAVFAHGVRLNMLEFSNNAGVQWSGYPYRPFAAEAAKES